MADQIPILALKSWKTGTNDSNLEPVLILETFEGAPFGVQMSAFTAIEIGRALTELGERLGPKGKPS